MEDAELADTEAGTGKPEVVEVAMESILPLFFGYAFNLITKRT
jgi:hypothetical protein